MAPRPPTPSHLFTLFTFILLVSIPPTILANDGAGAALKLTSAEEWPMSMGYFGLEEDDEVGDGLSEVDGDNEEESEIDRRSLFWRRVHYYISYGALSANRIPCPPRSGRSYYTHSCFKARSPVNPYYRGCSRITRCRK